MSVRRVSGLRLVGALCVLLASSSLATAQVETSGALRGTVRDVDFGVPLQGVRVLLVESGLAAVTGSDGTFLMERLPAGRYTLSVTKPGYERQLLRDVAVPPGRMGEVSIGLSIEIVEMEELVVTAEDILLDSEVGLLEIRADALVMQDAISSELIAKAGATDAAGALKLVVGASVVGGKYATVRGLSDRYTGTTLNGVRVPSPDPRRRAVQVDLFPTGTIETVTVSKTFTPDLQGDFTGGGVDIRTKSIPEARFLKVSISGEYNSEATGNDAFLTYRGGGVGATGFSGSERDLPAVARESIPAPPNPKIISGSGAQPVTPEETAAAQKIDELTRAFVPVMGVSRGTIGPGSGFSIVGGNRKALGDEQLLGWIAALTSSRKSDFYEDGINATAAITDAEQAPGGATYVDSRGTEEILQGLLASMEWQYGSGSRLTGRVVANHGAEDEARFQYQPGPTEIQNQSLTYTERNLLSPQVQGRHVFGGGRDTGLFGSLTLDWLGAVNSTSQYEPDVRLFYNGFNPTLGTGFAPNGTNDPDRWKRIWRDIDEKNRQLALDASLPFHPWGRDGLLKAGGYLERAQREYKQDSFYYSFQPQRRPRTPSDLPAYEQNRSYSLFSVSRDCAESACGPDQLWTDVFLDPSRIGLATNLVTIANQLLWYASPLGDDVDYDGDQAIDAAYAMIDVPILKSVRLVGGARWERTSIGITPYNSLNKIRVIEIDEFGNRALAAVDASETAVQLDDPHWLPSVGAIWEIHPRMNLRASWSRTIARPTFRELAPVATQEYLAGDSFIGNQDLQLSSIENADLRWEWFLKGGDVLATSVFRKQITDPIEYISFNVAGIPYIQPLNYQEGEVDGFELEARTGLGPLWAPLGGLSVGANYTSLDSTVKVPADEQASLEPYGLDQEERRLQGQPDHITNVYLSYDNLKYGISAGVFFNDIGEILLTGAARGATDATPDAFEARSSSLDATYTQRLKKGFSLGFKARNILRDPRSSFYRLPDGLTIVKTDRTGPVTFGVSLTWAW